MERKIPGILKRVLQIGLPKPGQDNYSQPEPVVDTEDIDKAELVSSKVVTPDGTVVGHAPVLDLDKINVELVESTTPGHYHLYIDKVMPWDNYVLLLDTLYRVGILEFEFVQMSKQRGFSSVRLPWVKKEMSDEDRRVREIRDKLREDPSFPDALLMNEQFSRSLREEVRADIERQKRLF